MANYVSNNAGYEIDNMIDSYLSFRKTIKVFAPEDSTIIVTYSSSGIIRNVPGFKYSNYTLFFPEKYGTYNVDCIYKGINSKEILDIDTVKIYEVFFSEDVYGYLTLRSANQFSLSTSNSTKNWNGTLEYSTDKELWNIWDGTTTITPANNVLYLRGTGNSHITGGVNNSEWNIVGTDVNCTGNIETLLDYATVELGNHPTMSNSCYEQLFANCTSLTTAPALPATTLTMWCYAEMFNGCTSLTTAPELPATTLAARCYDSMFVNCQSLTTVPELPATTLAGYCYYMMFSGCTGLTMPATLPATTLAAYCYSAMFLQCSNIKLYTSSGSGTVEYRIPSTGTGITANNALTDMFRDTGGDNIGTPIINTTYYL